jgi:hypothetical protein
MATIPNAIPTVAPTSQGLPGVNVRAVDDAFGAGVARADQQFGKQLESSADEIFKQAMNIQQTRNDAAAKEADAAYTIRSGDLYAEYQAKQGQDAVNARPKFVEDLGKLREEVRGSLTNPAAQRMFDGTTRQSFARTVFATAAHAATESRRAAVAASSARVEAAYDNSFRFPDSPDQAKSNLQIIQDEVRDQAKIKGLGRDETIKAVGDATSKYVANQAIAMSRKDPEKAWEILQQNDKILNQGDRERAERIVVDGKRNFRARDISSKVLFGVDPENPEKSLQEAIDEGLTDGEKYYESDPAMKDAIKDRIETDWNKMRRVKKDGEFVNRQTLNSLVLTPGENKQLPTSLDQIFADPAGRAAWDRAVATKDTAVQKSIMGQLRLNANNVIKETNLGEENRLKGLAANDPEEFLNQDIIANKQINDTSKRKLLDLQRSLKAKAETDPRVQKAMGILAPDLRPAGITRDRPDEYNQFTGALQDAIEQFQQENKKAPKAEDIRKIGAQLMQASGRENWWSKDRLEGRAKSFWGTGAPMYKTEVPEKEIPVIKDAWQRRFGAEPTDAQVQRLYAAQQYQKLFGKKVLAPAGKDQTKVGGPQVPVSE